MVVRARMVGLGIGTTNEVNLLSQRLDEYTLDIAFAAFGGRNRTVISRHSSSFRIQFAPLHTSGDARTPVLEWRTLGQKGSHWPLQVRRR